MNSNTTKKHAIELLKSNSSTFYTVGTGLNKNQFTILFNEFLTGKLLFKTEKKRTVISSNSNSLTFSNNSKLYFNNIEYVYKIDNAIAIIKTFYDDFDNNTKYYLLCYIFDKDI